MDKFIALDKAKQQKILDAALKEFAENGYEQASTNRIVKGAGIGKGMLFYYFKSKKELYDYLTGYSLDFMMENYFNLVDVSETDFIERLQRIAEVKIKAQSENRNVFNFIGTLLLAKDSGLPSNIQKKYEDMQKIGNEMLYKGIDTTMFRDDVDVEKAFKLIRWSMDGYQNELLHKLEGQRLATVDFEPYWQEFYGYLDILKKSFYKERKQET
ncbi:TetR family transcriptional regulator [Planomicrobium soli]|uniref:TetR family transcriptional regulator n=1 Tax=Planomicrobium soli TaxID=1176648 RepID=A0A2P8H238_9BACL|nr:TetR/AcrR family transcriptional regulator [Planomicrobium soli]PSL40271.1 TetR family transcriptional regulator [Planomicrobium soli]